MTADIRCRGRSCWAGGKSVGEEKGHLRRARMEFGKMGCECGFVGGGLVVGGRRPLRQAAALSPRYTRTCNRAAGTVMRMRSSRSTGGVGEILYVEVKDPTYDIYKLEEAVEILKAGGVGVIPTDTCYAFVCALSSREGINRIYSMKQGLVASLPVKKPLSMLCKDFSMLQRFVHSLDRSSFKLLKNTLPGPYTYILPTSSEVPRMVIEHKSHRKSWKRREIGVRIPDDPYCAAILDQMDEPLLSSSVPQMDESGSLACNPAEIGDNWCSKVDFVLDHGERESRLSTVVNMTTSPPSVIRVGEGDASIFE